MTTQGLIAFAYCGVAILLGGFLCKWCFPEHKKLISRIVWCWFILTGIAFIITIPALYFVLTAAVLMKFCPSDTDEKLLFYGAMLPALPDIINWMVPFPGINYLLDLDYIRILNLVVLTPLILNNGEQNTPYENSGFSKAALFVLLYMACIIALDWREDSPTNAARHSLDILWVLGMPVLALIRCCKKAGSVEKLYFGVLIAAFMMAIISLFQAIEGWKFYTEISRNLSSKFSHLYNITYVRGSFLRTPATLDPIPFSIYMSFAILLLYKFRHASPSKFILPFVYGLFAFAIFTTGSRAGYLSLVMLFGIYFFLNPRLKHFRGITVFLTLLLIVPYVVTGLSLDSFTEYDEHGTFEYRIELFFTSLELIKENFLFGERFYNRNPELEVLRQGQGIIDVVNAYLHIAMRYGMVGLSLMLTAIWLAVSGLWRARKKQESQPLLKDNSENTMRTTIAIIVAFCAAIATVSFIDRLEIYFWIFVVAGGCLVQQHRVTLNDRTALSEARKSAP